MFAVDGPPLFCLIQDMCVDVIQCPHVHDASISAGEIHRGWASRSRVGAGVVGGGWWEHC